MTLAQRAQMLRGQGYEQETKQDNGEKVEDKKNKNEAEKGLQNRGHVLPIGPTDIQVERVGKNISWFDKIILALVGALQNIAFLFSTIADFALACFFYYSLGFDDLSKIVLTVFGGVQTGGKLWGWSTRKIPLAVLCAVLSVLATLTVFLSVIDMQSESTKIQKSKIVLSIEADIDGKNAEQKILQDRLNLIPKDYTTAANGIIKTMAENDAALRDLRKQLAAESNKKADALKLDAWRIFRQLVDFNYKDPAHFYALAIILLIAVLLEVLIFYTTPRKSLFENGVQDSPSRNNPK
jgi:hypothetical protein